LLVFHVFPGQSRKDVVSEMTCLIGQRVCDQLSPLTGELPEDILRKIRVGEGQVGNRLIDQDQDIADATVIGLGSCIEDKTRSLVTTSNTPEQLSKFSADSLVMSRVMQS
jgi:hypothetical protein